MKKQMVTIYRAERFSPNSVEKDRFILDAVVACLHPWADIYRMSEDLWNDEQFRSIPKDLVLSMARSSHVLGVLSQEGCPVVNTPQGVRKASSRRMVHLAMSHLQLPFPPSSGDDGYWLKRADMSAQSADDVQFLRTESQLAEAIRALKEKKISDFIVSAHVKGDLIKFYGVRHTPFFRYGYPTDLGQTKFGLEQYNGGAHHYTFSVDQLRTDVDRLAEKLGVDVYGGDCIVREDGSYCLIDFNDWPSFSWCQKEAAEAIAELVKQRWI